MDSVVHFELPAEDQKRMSDFYAKAFGWQIKQMGPEMESYVVVTTTESDQTTGRPKTPGAINGGFYKKNKDSQAPSVVIAVKDIKEAMEKVTQAGGKVIGGRATNGEPDEIPGVGLYASFIDSEGNRLSMLQPMGM